MPALIRQLYEFLVAVFCLAPRVSFQLAYSFLQFRYKQTKLIMSYQNENKNKKQIKQKERKNAEQHKQYRLYESTKCIIQLTIL